MVCYQSLIFFRLSFKCRNDVSTKQHRVSEKFGTIINRLLFREAFNIYPLGITIHPLTLTMLGLVDKKEMQRTLAEILLNGKLNLRPFR